MSLAGVMRPMGFIEDISIQAIPALEMTSTDGFTPSTTTCASCGPQEALGKGG